MRVSLFAYCSLRKGFAAPFKRSIHGYASTTAGLLPQRRHTAPPCQYCPGYPASTHKPYPPPASLSLTPSTVLRLSDAPSRHPSFPTTFSSPTAMPVRLSDFLLVRLIYSLSIYYLLLSLLLLPWPKFSARTSCPFRTPYGRQHVLDRTRTIYQFQTMKNICYSGAILALTTLLLTGCEALQKEYMKNHTPGNRTKS